ncbi:MAG TPA: AraC family transcriptional regulator [Rhodanobacteraceae bacterium]
MSRTKLDASQLAPEVIPYLLVTLGERVAAMGIAPARLCAGLDFDMADLRAGLPVANRQAWRMIRRALQLSGRADLGLEVGLGQDLGCFGALGQAMVLAPDVGTALALAVRHYPAGGALVDVDLDMGAAQTTLILRPRLRDPRVVMFLVEEILASALELFGHELGTALPLQALELTYPRPKHAARYRESFGCEPRFDASSNACVIDAHWLQQPMHHHDATAFAQACASLQHTAPTPAADAVQAIETLLARPGHAAMSLPQLARALDLSERTLRRRLREANTSYRNIHDRVMADAAQRLLVVEGVTVAKTARQLGFADVHAFRRAYRRWSGCTPQEARNRQAAGQRQSHLTE